MEDRPRQTVFEPTRDSQVQYLTNIETSSTTSVGELLSHNKIHRPLIVTGSHYPAYRISNLLENSLIERFIFTGFSPNPTVQQIAEGIKAFISNECDSLISIGGGSAIDVAKCIKAFRLEQAHPEQWSRTSSLPQDDALIHIAVPTTAGTGSESTHFAVCYRNGQKLSIANPGLIPQYVILDESNLTSLPHYHRASTYLDALCQAVESYWSLKSTAESKHFAECSISTLLAYREKYFCGDKEAARMILRGANLSGKAINITTTTAAHALSYKLTSLYSIAHGHAVALCLPYTWQILKERAGDAPGTAQTLRELDALFSACNLKPEASETFNVIVDSLELPRHIQGQPGDIAQLVNAVDPQRLANYPALLDSGDIATIYESIVETS